MSKLKAVIAGSVKAAGPTTSIREEPYQADVIKRYGVRAVIGKGGMGQKTLAAFKGSRRCISDANWVTLRSSIRAPVEEVLGVESPGLRNSGSNVASASQRISRRLLPWMPTATVFTPVSSRRAASRSKLLQNSLACSGNQKAVCYY